MSVLVIAEHDNAHVRGGTANAVTAAGVSRAVTIHSWQPDQPVEAKC